MLTDAGIDSAAVDARALIIWAAGLDAAGFAAALREAAPDEALVRYDAALSARAARRPVSHIIGGRLFWGRWFKVTADVLDPRPETEIMIARALQSSPPTRVLELGVGSGCILGTMLAERPDATGLGVDASEAALTIAAANLESLDVAGRAQLRKGDWLNGVEGQFDLILCNPPYIAEEDLADLSPEVRQHEPMLALSPGGDGLDAYRAIAPDLRRVAAPGGVALFEIGPTQAEAVIEIFRAEGWPRPEVLKDFDGRDRCLHFVNQRPASYD